MGPLCIALYTLNSSSLHRALEESGAERRNAVRHYMR